MVLHSPIEIMSEICQRKHPSHDQVGLRLGQTGERVCYGGKTDKTCRIWLSGDKIHLL